MAQAGDDLASAIHRPDEVLDEALLADDLAGFGPEVRVLEPAPPAIEDEPWFADDPAARGYIPPGRTLVSPVTSGSRTVMMTVGLAMSASGGLRFELVTFSVAMLYG